MPIYAFACQACGHAFDSLQRMSDPDPAECPECGAAQIKRQLTAPSFRLSGSGWYETDFKKAGDRKRNIAGDGGDSGSSGSDAATPSGGAKEGSTKGDAGSPRESGGASDKPSNSAPAAKSEPAPAARSEPKPASKPAEGG